MREGRYYQNSNSGGEQLLHRVIWEENFGKIPEGMCIHHINGDWTDNTPSNLTLLDNVSHSRLHMIKRFEENPAFLEESRKNLSRAILLAPAWHASDEGKKWHSEASKKSWMKFEAEREERPCKVCGSIFKAIRHKERAFCSMKCWRKHRKLEISVTRSCAFCGGDFMALPKSPKKVCSPSCRNKLRYKAA